MSSTSPCLPPPMRWLLLAYFSSTAAIAQVPTPTSPAANGPGNGTDAAASGGNNACNNPAAEQSLRAREAKLLGPRHAEEHAQSRARKCRIDAGLDRSSPVITAATSQPTSNVGQWRGPTTIPVIGITTVLLHTGEVLFWSYDPANYMNPNASNTGKAYVWNPATGQGTMVAPPENIWCGGQTILADGRVFVAGGNLRYPDGNAPAGTDGWQGAFSAYTFNPGTKTWTRQPDMAKGRWYPTTTKLGDNRVVITSGFDETGSQALAQEVELFTPSSNIDGVGAMTSVGLHNPTGLYPFQYFLSTGQMLQAGPSSTNSVLLAPNTWNWSTAGQMGLDHYGYGNGIIYADASVSPAKQVVMVAGGENGSTAVSGNEYLDATNPAAGWRSFPRWIQPRHNANTVILPDGTLLTVGGNSASDNYGNTLYQAELYNKPPTDLTGTWVAMQPNSLPAAYHSTAILLPNATVLLSKDDLKHSSESHQVDIYSPPYLFKGARPQITSAPTTATYGQTFTIGSDTNNIASAMLIAPGATTHANDMHQRAVKMQIRSSGRNLQATVPPASLLPPGYYMLFILDNKGVPSTARFVRIG